MTAFKDLSLGDTFDFIGEGRFNSYFKRCKKTGKRMYRSIEPEDAQAAVLHIGSGNAKVFHVGKA